MISRHEGVIAYFSKVHFKVVSKTKFMYIALVLTEFFKKCSCFRSRSVSAGWNDRVTGNVMHVGSHRQGDEMVAFSRTLSFLARPGGNSFIE